MRVRRDALVLAGTTLVLGTLAGCGRLFYDPLAGASGDGGARDGASGLDARADGPLDGAVDDGGGGRDGRVPIPDGCVAGVEACNGADDDCDGLVDDESDGALCSAGETCAGGACAAGGTYDWDVTFGGPYAETVEAGAIDGSGNVVVVGQFDGMVDFGGGVRSADAAYQDGYVVSFDSAGGWRWDRVIRGDYDYDVPRSVAATTRGDVYVGGSIRLAADFGGGRRTGGGGFYDGFVVRYDPMGGHVWDRVFGGSGSDLVHGVAVGGGRVVVGAQVAGSIDVGGGAGGPAAEHAVLAAYDEANAFAWDTRSSAAAFVRAVEILSDGSVVAVGSFSSPVDFGGGVRMPSGFTECFVLALRPDGGYAWDRTFGSPMNDDAVGVDVGPADDIAVTGWFLDTVDLGDGLRAGRGRFDAYVVVFDRDGTPRWNRIIGGTGDDHGTDVAYGPSGNLVVSGYFASSDFDAGAAMIRTATGFDAFVASYVGATGAPRWDRAFGGPFSDFGEAVDVAPDGRIELIGTYQVEIDLGGGRRTGSMANVFIVALRD